MDLVATRFRTSFTSTDEVLPARIVEGKVVGFNLVSWTVNVVTSFDMRRFYDIQVSSMYVHYSNGEGLYAFPEVGAKCYVCVPSDSTAPFVLSFIMPPETIDGATEDAPSGTSSKGALNGNTNTSSYSGGRPRIKPGDIFAKTRDGNFLILHRGGVLQLGATELAQRIYIPLNNYIMDISENYVHHNHGGTMHWGIQPTTVDGDYPAEQFECFRIYAGDKYATLRLKTGKVDDPVKGELDGEISLGQIVYELVLAPQGFNVETGTVYDAKQLKLRFTFDKTGKVLLGTKGELSIFSKDKISIKSDKDVNITAGSMLNLKASSGAIIDGGAYTHVKGGVVKVGPGSKPTAHQGSMVQITLPGTPVLVPGGPPLVLYGIVLTGEPTVLV